MIAKAVPVAGCGELFVHRCDFLLIIHLRRTARACRYKTSFNNFEASVRGHKSGPYGRKTSLGKGR